MRVVRLDMRGVDDEEEVPCGEAVDEQIVDEGSPGRQQPRVVCLADIELRGVVARDELYQRQGIAPGDLDLAHVADIEEARPLADRGVLGRNAGVLDRHVPAAKRNHLSARRAMTGVERRLLERRLGGVGLIHEGAGLIA